MGQMNARIIRERRRGESEPEPSPPPRVARPKLEPRDALGVSLEFLRINKELSRKEVAAKADVTEYAIEQLEKGLSPGNATVEDLRRIALAVSCHLTVNNLKVWRERTTINTVFKKGGSFKFRAIPANAKK